MNRVLLSNPILVITGMLALACTSAHADCTYPRAPTSVPDGSTATEAEMTAAAAVFKQYNTDVTAYLACLQQETTAKSAGVPANQVVQIRSMQSKKHNSAVDELESTIARFNEQLRAFKKRA